MRYNDLIGGLNQSLKLILPFLETLNKEDLVYRYTSGKWSIKQIWEHVVDVERVLSYRALRYARQDLTVLSGFDENKYATMSIADARDQLDLI